MNTSTTILAVCICISVVLFQTTLGSTTGTSSNMTTVSMITTAQSSQTTMSTGTQSSMSTGPTGTTTTKAPNSGSTLKWSTWSALVVTIAAIMKRAQI